MPSQADPEDSIARTTPKIPYGANRGKAPRFLRLSFLACISLGGTHHQKLKINNSNILTDIDDSQLHPPWSVEPTYIPRQLLTTPTVVLQSEARPAQEQEQRRAQIATPRPQDRARFPTHPENRRRRCCETHQDVRFPPAVSPGTPSYFSLFRKGLSSRNALIDYPLLYLKLTAYSQSSHDLRKSIARVLTYIHAQQRTQLRLLYKGKKYLPLDLRAKKTRAIRRRLTKFEATRVTEKQKKRQMHFPLRKYAVKVRLNILFVFGRGRWRKGGGGEGRGWDYS